MRILKVSDTKKTILINRGIEDGLTKGDHAKFFLTSGVVARGLIIRISPSRSVWSLYRLVDRNEITENKMINLKITPAVNITDDPTQAFANVDSVYRKKDPNILDMPPEQGGRVTDVVPKNIDSKTATIASDVNINPRAKSWEVSGIAHLAFLSSNNSTGADDTGTSGSGRTIDLTLAVEKYFLSLDKWYSQFSLYPLINYYAQDNISVDGQSVKTSFVGYGLGLSYHFLDSVHTPNTLIGFFTTSFGLGSVSEETILVDNADNQQADQKKGSANFFSLGLGFKYLLTNGAGFKFLIDYYRRGESYEVEDASDTYTKVVQGPRVLVGLAYRF